MRFWFSLGLFAFSVAYFIYGLNTLNFHTPFGRPGPGYFPALVGAGLILGTGINLVKDLRMIRQRGVSLFSISALADSGSGPKEIMGNSWVSDEETENGHYPMDVLVLVGLVAGLILLLNYLGGLLSMVVFMFVLLSVMNYGKWVENTLYSILLPMFLYLLFDVWLNASLPIGIFGI